MPSKLKLKCAVARAGGFLTGGAIAAAFTGFVLASAEWAVVHLDGQRAAALASLRPAAPLLQPVALKSDTVTPREVSPLERHDIQNAIRAQIRAYAARDAEQAFARLALSTQRLFDKPDNFLRSVAQETPIMLDTRRFAFLGVEQIGSRVVQQVLVTDSTGRQWLAEFQLEQQRGGACGSRAAWCRLRPASRLIPLRRHRKSWRSGA